METENVSPKKEVQSSEATSTSAKPVVKEEVNQSKGRLAVILVRGMVNVTQSVKDTLKMLRLNRKNHCVVLANTPLNLGMLKKVKDYITWGELDEETYNELVAKRGEEFQGRLTDFKQKYSYKYLEINGKKYKPCFRLNPPRKGFGRKGIKMAFNVSGALGNRGDKINDLIKRML
ncbi:50S ribosomal protein L30 [Candidatus Woesearchaeota archaeon]|jgi:large subunit ribosomal protein L30|nr:50S ribosomal protein L30 [Candidatus Woesearchaeota archaeon]